MSNAIDSEKNTTNWLITGYVCLLLLLPARVYTQYTVSFFRVHSNLNVFYVNLFDLLLLGLSIITLLPRFKLPIHKKNLTYVCTFMVIEAVSLLLLIITGHSDYIGEVISKTHIVLCAYVFVVCASERMTWKQKSSIYVIALIILVLASFFLSGYAAYSSSNRVGSLGFGSNETAMFACALIAISLFSKTFSVSIRTAVSIVSFMALLNIASRRGIVVALLIILAWILSEIVIRRKNHLRIKTLAAVFVIALIVLFIWIRYQNQILAYIYNSPFALRYRYLTRSGGQALDFSDRGNIFSEAIEHIIASPILGYYGSDLFLAQGAVTHSHNMILQMLVTHGVILGSIIALFFIVSFVRALRLIIWSRNNECDDFPVMLSAFYIPFFVFELAGYLLWNPKGLFLIITILFFLNEEYLRIFHVKPERV